MPSPVLPSTVECSILTQGFWQQNNTRSVIVVFENEQGEPIEVDATPTSIAYLNGEEISSGSLHKHENEEGPIPGQYFFTIEASDLAVLGLLEVVISYALTVETHTHHYSYTIKNEVRDNIPYTVGKYRQWAGSKSVDLAPDEIRGNQQRATEDLEHLCHGIAFTLRRGEKEFIVPERHSTTATDEYLYQMWLVELPIPFEYHRRSHNMFFVPPDTTEILSVKYQNKEGEYESLTEEEFKHVRLNQEAGVVTMRKHVEPGRHVRITYHHGLANETPEPVQFAIMLLARQYATNRVIPNEMTKSINPATGTTNIFPMSRDPGFTNIEPVNEIIEEYRTHWAWNEGATLL